MNPKIKAVFEDCGTHVDIYNPPATMKELGYFAEQLIKGCIDEIETYRIPVGNSASGELACEWTYAALKEIRDNIKERFGL